MQPSDDEHPSCSTPAGISSTSVDVVDFIQNLGVFWLLGSDAPSGLAPQAESTYIASNITEISALLTAMSPGTDLVELCGGEARTSTMCVRRGLASGGNFDIVTNCDLNDPAFQKEVERFCDVHKPLVAVSAPTCRAFGPH